MILSKKIELVERNDDVGKTEVFLKRDVKEFIKKIKERIKKTDSSDLCSDNGFNYDLIIKIIDEKAGDLK